MQEPQQNPNDPYGGMDFVGVEFAYATNFVSTHTNREFFLTFACLSPDKLGSKKLRCVARVVVGSEHMMELITVLKRQFDEFQRLRKGEAGEGSEGFRR